MCFYRIANFPWGGVAFAQGPEEPYFEESPLLVNELSSVVLNDDNYKMQYKNTAYWKKHKRLKRWAWGTLGAGVPVTFVGCLVELAVHYNDDPYDDNTFGLYTPLLVGAALMLSSIPLFVFSYTNAKKAKQSVSANFTVDNIYVEQPNGRRQTQPAVGIQINF